MGNNIVAGILGFVVSTVMTFFHLHGALPNQLASFAPTPTVTITSAPTPTDTPTPTNTPTPIPTIKLLPTITPTPTIVPTPTVDQKAVDICNSAFMPVVDFAGHSCLFADDNFRWMDSVNGHPATESYMDNVFKGFKEDEIKPMILKQCLKTTKEKFEKCSTSIRDNAARIRDEIASRMQSDVQNCIASSSKGGDMQRNFTSRYMAKDRLKGKIPDLYDFCSSHNDSVAEFHP